MDDDITGDWELLSDDESLQLDDDESLQLDDDEDQQFDDESLQLDDDEDQQFDDDENLQFSDDESLQLGNEDSLELSGDESRALAAYSREHVPGPEPLRAPDTQPAQRPTSATLAENEYLASIQAESGLHLVTPAKIRSAFEKTAPMGCSRCLSRPRCASVLESGHRPNWKQGGRRQLQKASSTHISALKCTKCERGFHVECFSAFHYKGAIGGDAPQLQDALEAIARAPTDDPVAFTRKPRNKTITQVSELILPSKP